MISIQDADARDAFEHAWAIEQTGTERRPGLVAHELVQRGYPVQVAVRVACTPRRAYAPRAFDPDAHPGQELHDALAQKFSQSIRMLAVALAGADLAARRAL